MAAQVAASPLEWLSSSRGTRMACCSSWRRRIPRAGIGTGVSQGQAHPHFFFPFLFFLILSGFGFGSAFPCDRSFLVFPTHPLHGPSRIDRGVLPGIAAFRLRLRLAWLRLAAPGCLLGGTLGGLSAAAPGYRDSIGRSNTRRLGALH